MKLTQDEIRQAAESDLLVFIRLVAPHLCLGSCHEDLLNWWQSSKRKNNTLVLLPRAHLKSQLLAYKTVWELTKDPAATILYVSATADLAEKQLYLMKNILTCKIYTKYWPDMVHPEEGKREAWNASEIAIDHPKRKLEGVRDPSIKTAGLTTNITGFHASNVKLDDVVVPNNAYTEDGRNKVANQLSQIASIKVPEAIMDCVGTRYHPKDQYQLFLDQKYKIYDDNNEVVDEESIWDSYIQVVEEDGEFLWPRQQRKDGKWFGFDMNTLSRIKAEYTDRTQFYSQYYNNPNDPESMRIGPDKFQYYDRKHLKGESDGYWYYGERRLNVFAAIDFAFSIKKKADYTALVVVGIDCKNNIYILDIDRFKSDRISDYFDSILRTYQKWGYRKLRAEISVAQEIIVKDLQDNYIRPNGLSIVIDKYRPTRNEGNKYERIAATLEPKYDNRQMWHFKGGLIATLEEELMLERPPHDDVKDALTAAISVAVAPADRGSKSKAKGNVIYNSRFGGIAFR